MPSAPPRRAGGESSPPAGASSCRTIRSRPRRASGSGSTGDSGLTASWSTGSFPYQELCAEPERIVGEIAETATGARPALDIPPLEALDDEYERGGPLESANRVFKRTESFEMEGAERGDEMLDPLEPGQRETIERICGPLAAEMNLGLG